MEDQEESARESIFTIDKQRLVQQCHLKKVLSLVCLNNGCWHCFLENTSCDPDEPLEQELDPCGNACPFCDGTQQSIFVPVIRKGLVIFLVQEFIICVQICTGDIGLG